MTKYDRRLHCHVNASPARKEMMTRDVIDSILKYMQQNKPQFLDLTGGAPELNQHFKYFVTESKKLGIHVIDRCNLTILLELGCQVGPSFPSVTG